MCKQEAAVMTHVRPRKKAVMMHVEPRAKTAMTIHVVEPTRRQR